MRHPTATAHPLYFPCPFMKQMSKKYPKDVKCLETRYLCATGFPTGIEILTDKHCSWEYYLMIVSQLSSFYILTPVETTLLRKWWDEPLFWINSRQDWQDYVSKGWVLGYEVSKTGGSCLQGTRSLTVTCYVSISSRWPSLRTRSIYARGHHIRGSHPLKMRYGMYMFSVLNKATLREAKNNYGK